MAARADGAEPRVPPGRDPGGVAVAVIETGIDYTLPALAGRLARDGEGEIIGWDFVDNDRRPFKTRDDLEEMDYTHRGTAMALTVAQRAKTSRIEPVRIATGAAAEVQKGLAFAAQTPARIAVLALETSTASLWAAVHDAMHPKAPPYLLVVAAGEDPLDLDRIKEHLAPPLDSLTTVLVITACDRNGHALTTAEGALTKADIAVNTEAFTAELITANTFSWKPEASIAAAEVAALAARMLEEDPALDPAGLKARILALAVPFAENQEPIAKSGWIAEPWRHAPQR